MGHPRRRLPPANYSANPAQRGHAPSQPETCEPLSVPFIVRLFEAANRARVLTKPFEILAVGHASRVRKRSAALGLDLVGNSLPLVPCFEFFLPQNRRYPRIASVRNLGNSRRKLLRPLNAGTWVGDVTNHVRV